MALWQVSFAMFPNRHFTGSGAIVDARLIALLTGSEAAFNGFDLPGNYRSQIEVLLPPGKSWSPDLEIWGDPSSDDFSIWQDARGLSLIEVRLDVRKLDDTLIAGVLWIAKTWDCTLVEKDHRTICRFSQAEFRQFLAGHVSNRAMHSPDVWLPHLAEQAQKDREP